MTRTIRMETYCPFLTCLEPVPHEHPVCETCEAVRYGNFGCPTCQEHWLEKLKLPPDACPHGLNSDICGPCSVKP